MAIGGSLRAAMKAGNWAKAAMESRRRARALADLNARGGIRGTGIRENVSPEALFERGYGYGVTPPFSREMSNLPLENNGLPFAYTTRNMPPSGRTNYVNPETGARATFARDVGLSRYGNPIEAPFEGFRVLPQGPMNRAEGITNAEWFRRFGSLPEQPTMPWQGRGPAPMYDFDPGGWYGGMNNPTWVPDGFFPRQFGNLPF